MCSSPVKRSLVFLVALLGLLKMFHALLLVPLPPDVELISVSAVLAPVTLLSVDESPPLLRTDCEESSEEEPRCSDWQR
jgi:hypothetical protein